MKNKILAFVFSFVASMSLSTAWAWDFKVDSLYYTITSSTEPYTVEVAQDASYKAWTTVTLPNTVTNDGITYTVTGIAPYAFYQCQSLATITFPDSLDYIGDYSFSDCAFTELVIPDKVTSIRGCAFEYCDQITSVNLPDSLKKLQGHAFYGNHSLKSITIPQYVTEIATDAFNNSGINSVVWNAINYINPYTASPFASVNYQITSMTFGEGVQLIPAYMCYGMYNLTSVIIPESVVNIGDYAFYDCNKWLESVEVVYINTILFKCHTGVTGEFVIKDGTTAIASDAFRDCNSLTSITIPNSVTSIGANAFYGCTSLSSITIPEGINRIEGYTFRGCSSLTSITIPQSINYLANTAFFESGLKSITWHPKNYNNGNPGDGNSRSPFYYIKDNIQSITFGENVDTIPYRMCWEMYNLKSVSLPENLKSIEYDAFSACRSLDAIAIPNGVTYIGNYAFNECYSLPSITLPDSLRTIEQYAFRRCTLLTSITIPEKIAILSDRAFQDSGLDTIIWTPKNYDTGGSSPFYYIKDHIKSVIFTDNVEAIPWNMCWEMYNLQSVEIPNSVDTIRPYAFKDCRSLLSINIPKTVKHIDGGAFYGCSALTSIELPKGIRSMGDEMFYNCTVLTSISIPDSVTTIGRNVFYNSGITSVVWNPKDYNNTGNSPFDPIKTNITSITFSDNVEAIPYRMCYNMSNLTDINGGKNVKRIGKEAFYGVPFEEGLIYVGRVLYGYSGTMPDNYSLTLRDNTIGIANNAFQNQQNLLMITFNEGLEEIGSEAFRNCQALLSLKFPNSLRTIGNSAFYDCYGLTMAKLGGGLQSIGEYAFRYCSALNTSVTFPETLQTIGRGVFEGCTNVPSITVQGTVERIEESTFRGCNQLKTIVLPNTVNYIGQYAFYDCRALKDFALPSSLTKIDYRAFENNHALNSLVLPNSVDTLCDRAFYNCDGLNSVQFGENLKYIGKESFCESNNLKSVTFNESLLNIDDRAFQSCSQLQAAQLNQKLQRIGHEAFRYCGNLRNVTFGDSLATIGERAFKRSGITSADLSKTQITNLPTRAFRECGSLVSVNFPKTLAEMGTECFYTCQSLRLAELPQGMTTLPNHAFYGCTNLTSVHIPNSMVTIMNNVFQSCSNLLSVTLPENVLSVGAESFRYCSKLATLNLAMAQPISVGSNAFDGVTFSAINVPCGSKSTYMEDERWAVYDSIMHEVTLAPYNIIALPADGRRGVVDVQVPNTCDGDAAYTLTVQPYYGYKFTQWNDGNTDNPRSVVLTQDTSLIATIERDSYEINAVPNFPERGKIEGSGSYLYLDTVTLTVTPNYGYYFDYWQDRSNYSNSDSQKKANPRKVIANKDTTYTAILQKNQYTIQVEVTNPDLGAVNYPSKGYYLDTITMSSNVPVGYRIVEWGDGCTDDPRTFVLTQDTTFTATLGQAFNGKCGANVYWAFSDSTLTITGSGDMYDYNSNSAPWQLFKDSIKVITISDSITRIGNYAFYNIKGITSITIPLNLKNVGSSAFKECTGLRTLVWNAIRMDNESNLGYLNASYIQNVEFGNQVERIPNSLCSGMNLLMQITIPQSVKEIGDNAFRGCVSLTEIIIPNGVESLGHNAFYECRNLSQVVFNEGLQYISNSVFQNCSSLTNVVLPTTLEALGSSAFEGCSNLTTVQLPASMSSIGSRAFASLKKLVSVTCVGDKKEITELGTIGAGAFYDCLGLQELQIPEGIRAIEDGANGYNRTLKAISLPNSLDSLGSSVFYGCSSLKSVTIPAAVKYIGENALQDCGALQVVQMLPATPPAMVLNAISTNATIQLHCNSKESYVAMDAWAAYADNMEEKALSNHRLITSIADMGLGTVVVDISDCDGDGAYIITAQPNYGYKFTQWQDGNTDNPRKVVLTQDTTFVATMVRDGFLVQGVPNLLERGEVTGGTTALYGDTVTLTVTPNYGYYFSHWKDNTNNTSNPRKVIADKDTTYTAILQKNQYRVTVSATNPEYGTVSTSHGSAYYLDTIVLTANPILGYQLAKWNDGNTENPRRFVLTQDTTFTATFRQAFADRCGETAYWSYDNQGTLTITGSGDMYNYSSETAPWQLFKDSIKTIIISDSITRIGSYAFYNIKGITSLTIPTSLTQMGDYSISGCDSLTTLVWNARSLSVQNLGGLNASQLSSITFGNAVVDIPNNICNSMSQLKRLVLPASVKTIGYRSFYNCDSLVYVSIPLSMDSIGSEAFDACGGIDTIMYNAINLSKSTIGSLNRPSVSHVEFGSQVEYIPNDMCNGMTKLTKIVIPAKVKVIGNNAFRGCVGLEKVEIPSSVDSIDSGAFYGCQGLIQLTLNEGLISIGADAFRGCQALVTVTLPNSLLNIGDRAFYECRSMTMAKFGTGLESLGTYAFRYCSALNVDITLPETLKTIGFGAFEYCSKLPAIMVQGSVERIEGSTFHDCFALQAISLPSTVKYVGRSAFCACRALDSIALPDSLTMIDNEAFYGCSILRSFVLPELLDTIGDKAFYDCQGLTQVVFNEGLQYIGNSVFQNCSSLTNVVLPSTLETLGGNSFVGCSNLTTVQLPASMRSIGANAFASLKKLLSVTCVGDKKEITELGTMGVKAFYDCYGLKELQIPEGIRAIGSQAVGFNFDLTTISLPTTLDSIGANAINGCRSLKSITIPAAVKHIGENALQDCGALQVVQMLPATPPTMIGSAISSSATIEVPCGTKEAYISNDAWSSYTDKLVEKSLSNYRVQVSAQDPISGVVNVQSPDCDSDGAYTITAQPSYGYKFTQWRDGNTDNPRKVVLTQDTTFVATMVRDGFLVQGVPNYPERGEVTGGTTALYGDTVTLTVTPNYGYYFDYWLDRQNYYYESDRRENPRKVIADKDTTYTAVFQKKQYSITVNITNAEDGLGSISYPESGYYLDTITMTGSLEVGYKISWSDGSIDDPRKFVLTQDTTFTATIGQAYDGKCGDDVYWAFHDTILTITGTGDMYNYSQNNAPWQLFKEEIKEITIAEGITRIGNFAFYNIKGVTSIVIPESITSVGENALNNCSGLTTVVWNAKNCPTLNSNWIYRSSITSFTFGEQVEVIPSHVCYNLYKLSSIILPESVTSIGYSAFYGCSGISSLDIPAKVDSIAARAFYNCYGLDSLVVSCATKYIAADAFHANSLSTVTLKANSVEEYAQSNINKLLIDASVSATRKLLIGGEAPTDIIIPNTITRINYYAFWDVDGINSIIIPSSVTKIDSCAFYSDAIRTISIPCTVDSIGGTAFMPSTLENLIITTTNLEQFLQSDINLLLNAANANTVPRTLWANGAEVTNVLIPNSITEIKERAFYRMANITSVNIPEGVTKLGSYAFAGCNKLEVVKLPNSLDTIPIRTFDQCSLLATVDLGDSIKRIDDYAFASCFRLVTLRMPEALKSIGSYVFSSCSNLTSIHLPMLVPPTIISNKTFYAATKLSSFYVPCGAKDNYTSDANWSSFVSKINERYFTDYTITTASTNDAWGIVTLNEPTSCADTTYNVVAKPYEGYHFVQWQDGNTENPRTIALTQDTAFTAEFARNTYTISTRPNIVDRGVTSEAQSALYMDSVEIAAVAYYGYHFTQWNDGNTDNPRKVVVTEDKTYQAQFDKNRYAVHANCDDELGAITYPDSVEYLDVIELEVDPIFGYHFVQWQDGNTDNPRRVQITQDTTFTAYCAINEYAISVIANYEERGTTEGSGTYRHGDSITMSATAKYGYHFIRWQDSEEVDISKDAIYSTIVTKQIDYVAIFGKNVYQITTESTDNTKGYVDAVTHAEYLDEVILTAVPEVGYYFTQWNDGNTDNPRTIILTQDTAFTASFEIATSGSCGEDAFWSYQDGHLSISGQNDMYDYSGYSSTPWMLYREQIKSVSIADGVTRIGTNAFSNCTNLETIEIPNSVREIAAMAFANCGKLTTFTVPEQTIHIDADVFTGCAGITSITWNAISYQDSQKASTSPLKPLSEQITTFTVGEKVKYIPANLLPAMPALHTVNWNAVAGDDYYAHNNTPFYTNRDQIKVFTIGDNVEYIPEYLCYNLNAITAVQLPNTVTSVGAYAFAECSKLKDIAMGTALKVIGYRAFANCESIVELHIGESVETIDRYAFYNCNAVTKISIGSHVNWIGDHAFDNCTQVEEIYCYAPNPPTAERRTFYSYTPILRVSYTAGALYRSDSIFGLFNTIGYYDNTGVEDLVIDGITITNGTIHCNEPFTIYDLLGNNVTASNGSLQGVYIVRTASAAQKVVLNSNINL